MYNVLSSGSAGNCVVYMNSIAVDMGISFKAIEPLKNDLQVVLLTHIHGDHFNFSTIAKLAFERPALRFACGEFLKDFLPGIRNLDILEPGKVYDYGLFKVSPITLYHDVPNFGWRIFKDGKKIIHCTDSSHLEGIEAKDYDLYALEHNHCIESVNESIQRKQAKGEFNYQICAINSHLSEQQARDFIFKNKGEHSQMLRLHESRTF